MARPTKKGLDYFPLDINFLDDIKVRKLIKYQGGKAISVYALLLCTIYKSGYYVGWDEELPFIISEKTGFEEAYILEVTMSCLRIGLFNQDFFVSHKILTSKGVQERYNFICSTSKRICVMDDFCLINSKETGINSEETGINSEETGINSGKSTQRKGKKRKEKEKEEEEEKKEIPPPFKNLISEKPLPLRECLNLALQEQHWCEVAMMQLKIVDLSDLKAKMDTFLGSTILNAQEQEKTLKDYKQHFVNWCRRQPVPIKQEFSKRKIEIV